MKRLLSIETSVCLLGIAVIILGLSSIRGTLKRAKAAQVQTLVPLISATMGATTVSNVQMTAITNAAAQTVATPAGTRRVEIQAQDNNIRWRSDGTAPTATVGNIIYAGDTREFDASLGTIQLISTGGDAIANVHFAR